MKKELLINWYSVKETLPDEYHNIFVRLANGSITAGYYAYNQFSPASVVAVKDKVDEVVPNAHVEFTFEVTHWAEIPKSIKLN